MELYNQKKLSRGHIRNAKKLAKFSIFRPNCEEGVWNKKT